eukprot:gnl/MRDRNA2_/MRDRNA2_367572_c0_seq1.p1 gnl/MRDRNA2_/MRDRNA2_367572_c0~~gnl/MRDRNA2_/MRDRNA2_367572_c0_seq1.p1  ORF type:complete len:188 (+),score=25.01 gnl/MRDRNA2_/MRDRNA2_367572_c0_seq1:78-566(+)
MSAASSLASRHELFSTEEQVNDRATYRKSLARKYLQLESNTYRKHIELVDFALPFLKLDRDELKQAVCQHASTANMTARFILKDFASYVDSVIAPMAFLPFPGDAPCSIVHSDYALTKACMEQEMHAGIDRMIEEFGLSDLVPKAGGESTRSIHPHVNDNEL